MNTTLNTISILAAIDLLLIKYHIIPIISGIVTVPEDKSNPPICHTYQLLCTITLLLNINKPAPLFVGLVDAAKKHRG